MLALRLFLLGALDIRYDDQQLPKPPTQKSQSLLAYLAVHGQRPQPRERLADLFWGDRPKPKARSSLSTALWHLRRCLPSEACLLSDARTVQFSPEFPLWLDVEEFEASAARDDTSSLQAAVDLYRGDFLEDFYDDWILNERYRLESLFAAALERLMNVQEARKQYASAIAAALRLIQHDLLREDAYRLAMRAYCQLGRRDAAVDLYRRCQDAIRRELEAEPMAETRDLYESILTGCYEVTPAVGAVPTRLPIEEPMMRRVSSPLDVVARSPLVGREDELAFLQRSWHDAITGQGQLVWVLGEAGIGKTRLVEEFADQVGWQGARVLWGCCYLFERLLPYQPIAESLRAILPGPTPEERQALPAWAVAQAASLVPEIAEDTPDASEPSSEAPDQQQTRLFAGVAQVFAQFSSHGPLLIVLEDLHWASESTLQMIHYLVRHLVSHPILFVGTLRPEEIGPSHPLWSLQQQLDKAGLARSLALPPLSPQALEALLIETSGVGKDVEPLAMRLALETEGNPFFLNEIVKALFERGMIRLEHGVWEADFLALSEKDLPLPASLTAVIEARVRDLEDKAQEALRLAAVLGREFDLDVLSEAWGQGKDATLEALEVLLRHRLIEETTSLAARDYTFSHHKIQEVIYAGIPHQHRQYAHARAGLAMERVHGREAEEWAAELAFHFEQGRQYDHALNGKAIAYGLQAGDRLRVMYAHGDAVRYYQSALALLKQRGDYEQAARTLMKLGLTYHTAFDFRRAREAYDEGFVLWQRSGHAERPSRTPRRTLRLSQAEPTGLDPALAYDTLTVPVLDQLFSGLVELTPELDIVPDIARAWEILDGGRRYVFHLRDDCRWSDGAPVVAEDFCLAWRRVLDPEVGSPAASLLYAIKGARAFHHGEVSDSESMAVRAPDPTTLVVELEEPTAYFLQALACSPAYPVPRHMVQKHGPAWTDEVNLATNGPFRLERWEKGELLVLSHNPDWHGSPTGNVSRVELSFSAEPPTQLQWYEADELHILDMQFFGPVELDAARALYAGEYVTIPQPFTSYVGFAASQSPFHDPRVRRAFVQATDRETLADVIMRGFVAPALGGFVPPGMPGHSPRIGLPYDPDQARQLLRESGYPGGRDFPLVELMAHTDPASAVVAPILQSQWQENLGLTIRWQAVEWADYLDRINRRPPHLFLWAWVADYPDPDSFLSICPFRDQTRWQNEAYNSLVERASQVLDQPERLSLYKQADRMLIGEAAILPLAYYRSHLLVKPAVVRIPLSPVAYWLWKDVVIESD